jgi:hypothetical protein
MYVPGNICISISTLKSESHTFVPRLVRIFQQTTIGSLSSPNSEHNTASKTVTAAQDTHTDTTRETVSQLLIFKKRNGSER